MEPVHYGVVGTGSPSSFAGVQLISRPISGIEDQALEVIMFQGFTGPGILFNDQIQN